MEMEFIVQDSYGLCRPQWKLATNLEEAGRLFAEAVSQNYKNDEPEKPAEPEELDEDSLSDGIDGDELPVPEADERQSSSDEAEAETEVCGTSYDHGVRLRTAQAQTNGETKHDSDFEDIVVTRQEEQRDPEAEAEFDRELAKMMSEGADARKPDRKALLDVPLPLRKAQRESTTISDDSPMDGHSNASPTMAFSLMTKRGNRQQVLTLLNIFFPGYALTATLDPKDCASFRLEFRCCHEVTARSRAC